MTPSSPYSGMVLNSSSGPNMHSFICLSKKVIFMDIIGPPYNDSERSCIYYDQVPNDQLDISIDDLAVQEKENQNGSSNNKFKDISSITLDTGEKVLLDVVTLVDITPVDIEYHCHSEIYKPLM